MRDVVALGIGQTVFGKHPDKSAHDLGQEAVGAAIEDCGIDPRDIQVAYTARAINATTDSQKIMMAHGVTDIEMFNVQNACAGGSTAVRGVWKDIASGLYDVGIAVGVEAITRTAAASAPLSASQDLESTLGLTMPALFANIARRQLDTQDATVEDFARVSAKNHRHAVGNPFAQYQKELTEEEILASRMISDPITLLQCCPEYRWRCRGHHVLCRIRQETHDQAGVRHRFIARFRQLCFRPGRHHRIRLRPQGG